MSSPGPGLVLAVAAASSFGMNIAFARMASFAGVSGTAIVFYRVFLVLVLAGIAMAILRQRLRIAPGEMRPVLMLAASTSVVGLAYLSAVSFIPITVAVVILYTFPLLIVIATPFVEGIKRDMTQLAVAGLAFIGVAIVIGPSLGDLDWRGLALAAIASVAATVQFFAASRSARSQTLPKIVWIHLIALPVTAAIGMATGSLPAPDTLMNAPFAVAATIAGYVVGVGLQLAALARTSAAAAGIAFCAEPVVAAISSVVVLGETMTLPQAVGGALVIASIAANVIVEQRRARFRASRFA